MMLGSQLRITFLMQDDPFFLPFTIAEILSLFPKKFVPVCIAILPQSVSGKQQSLARKVIQTISVFGVRFFIKYACKFVFMRFIRRLTVASVANSHGIPIISVAGSVNSCSNVDVLSSYKPDIFVSIGASQIFKEKLLSTAPFGCLNLHTGMLPKYRGLMPTFWAMLNDEKTIGVSVFLVDEGIDSGPIVVQRNIEVGDLSQSALIRATKSVGAQAIVESLELVCSGGFELIQNSDEEATYFGFPSRHDVKNFLSKGKRF